MAHGLSLCISTQASHVCEKLMQQKSEPFNFQLNVPAAMNCLLCHVQWNFGFELKFGLYEWTDDGTQERKLREGAKV